MAMTAPATDPQSAALPVYLIHWDAPAWCAASARSLLASVGQTIVLNVIDNGQRSGEPLGRLLPPGVRVVTTPGNVGYAGGANVALDDWGRTYARCEFCLIGSHDLHVAPDALARLVEVAETRPEAGIVAPTIESPTVVSGGRWDGRRAVQVPPDDDPGRAIVDRDWASGTCLLLRRSCVDEVGRFDERLGSYVEDVDYGLRAHDHGWAVLCVRDARVSGLGSASPDGHRRITCNTVLVSAKRRGWHGASSSSAFFTARIAMGYAASLRSSSSRFDTKRSRALARQRLAGLWDAVSTGRLWQVVTEERRRRRAAEGSGR
jgi:N-acetylglucosaminyl-diphospho-decaprenol L-rhamnosyltransferase